MRVVVDISVVLAWSFEEEQTPEALKILSLVGKQGLLVPPLWWTELENGMLMGERRGRRSRVESTAFTKLVRRLPIRTDDTPRYRVSDAVMDLGRRHQLTAYDATYVELAVREGLPLATFDAAIRACGAVLGLRLLPDLKG